jgi:hypothetical protein
MAPDIWMTLTTHQQGLHHNMDPRCIVVLGQAEVRRPNVVYVELEWTYSKQPPKVTKTCLASDSHHYEVVQDAVITDCHQWVFLKALNLVNTTM